MVEIIRFERPSASPERFKPAIAAASNDRGLALIAREQYWQALSRAARRKGYADKAQRSKREPKPSPTKLGEPRRPRSKVGAIAQLQFLFFGQSGRVDTIAVSIR